MSLRTLTRLGAVVATALMIASTTACMSAPSGPTALSSQMEVDRAAVDLAAPEPGSVSTVADRSVVTTGTLTLEVADPEQAAKEAAGVAEQFGGSVAALNVYQQGPGATAAADLTIRVPAERFDEAIESLGGLGEVISESRNAQDVTTNHADLRARVGSLEAAVERLQQLMSSATSTADLLAAESALSERQQELDGLQAQLDSLTDQVTESTLFVSLTAPNTLPGGGPSTFWDGVLAGFASLGTVGAAALVILGVMLPWLVLATLIAAAVLLIVRRARRRHTGQRTELADPSPTVSAPAPAPNDLTRQ